MSFTRAAFVLVIGFLFSLPAYGQENSCQRRTVPVSLETKDASPASDLSSANLEGSYRNQAVHINLVAPEPKLPRIILLLDTSGSMKGSENQLIDMSEELLSKLPPAMEAGLAFFATDIAPVALPTTDREKLEYQLEALRKSPPSFKGRTALLKSVIGSVQMLGNSSPGDVIFVISDGEDNKSSLTEEKTAISLTRAGIRVFGLVFEDPIGIRNRSQEAASNINLWQMIENTGGIGISYLGVFIGHFPAGKNPSLYDKTGQPTQLEISLEEQRRQLSTFYRVEIDLPEAVDKPREWKLGLTGFSKPQLHNLILRYPHLLAPCQ